MCGIYGLLSSPAGQSRHDAEPFFRRLSELLGFRPGASQPGGDPAAILETVWALSYELIQRDGFVHVLGDPAIQERLEDSRGALSKWVAELERSIENGHVHTQEDVERVNQLIVGGRDLAWQIEKDVLANVPRVQGLVGGVPPAGEISRAVWAHAWGLNLVLNNIDRLEVRGRDSAGLVVYVHFPDGAGRERFVNELGGNGLSEELARRCSLSAFYDRAVVRPENSDRAILFTYKVANEVGEMGDNVRALRRAIAVDPIFQRALREPETLMQFLAHTRWASNGIVSIPNCHPVDSAIFRDEQPIPGSRGSVVAVLNGDIDNYQDLFREYVVEPGFRVDESITTDAKIIPIVIGHHYRQSGDLEDAFRRAFDAFEGSLAVGVMASDRPGEFLFGQKGSGQGLYLGLAPRTTCVASEMYGLVELTQSYVKAEGEQIRGGEIFRVVQSGDRTRVTVLARDREEEVPAERIRRAEITTRDINRGDYPRFLLKEISESVETVRKTIRGKFEMEADGEVRFLLGPGVLDPKRLEEFRGGKIRRIITIGQGTAAVAGNGIAFLLERVLRGSRHGIDVTSMKATELSGHHLRRDMSDTLILAVSQSGTTTDTNRTVDMARERGAWVIAIVNRRNSDLVYKSHGVLYTSDGRDIEMSVASTKAFYAQNVAGQILALALAEAAGALGPENLARELESLAALPRAMEGTLSLSEEVRELAEKFATRRRYWAIVGSGSEKIAADEIRIKLSELCYKSIAFDFTEDKKHIDLSSEPLVIVCASGVPRAMVSDVVKEVSIFKAHQSLPIVITHRGEHRYDPYASGVLRVPVYQGALDYLLSTMIGHLFGYHAASAFDRMADRLRAIRTGILEVIGSRDPAGNGSVEEPLTDVPALGDDLIARTRDFQESLWDGSLDSCLLPSTSVKLGLLFQILLGRLPSKAAARLLAGSEPGVTIPETIVQTLTTAVNELARPIDAIKHQAKTVTVGISRTEEVAPEGLLWRTIRDLELDPGDLAETHRNFLFAFEPLVAAVNGVTLYRVENLDAVGRPRDETTIRVLEKSGCASGMSSRCENGVPLSGTKWGVVRSGEIYLGLGQTDQKRILAVPLIGERSEGFLILYHLGLSDQRDPRARLRALSAHPSLLEKIRIAVTERSQEWRPELLDPVDNHTLFFENPEEVARVIVSKTS